MTNDKQLITNKWIGHYTPSAWFSALQASPRPAASIFGPSGIGPQPQPANSISTWGLNSKFCGSSSAYISVHSLHTTAAATPATRHGLDRKQACQARPCWPVGGRLLQRTTANCSKNATAPFSLKKRNITVF